MTVLSRLTVSFRSLRSSAVLATVSGPTPPLQKVLLGVFSWMESLESIDPVFVIVSDPVATSPGLRFRTASVWASWELLCRIFPLVTSTVLLVVEVQVAPDPTVTAVAMASVASGTSSLRLFLFMTLFLEALGWRLQGRNRSSTEHPHNTHRRVTETDLRAD